MVPEKYRLESIGRFLLEEFDRRLPGLTAWTPEIERALLAEAEATLAQMETQCRELGINDPNYWAKVRGVLQSVLLPRYAQLAKEEIKLSQAGYHLWRNGDLVARLAFAGAGLVLGAAAVAIPFIPVTEKWVPWLLFVGGPLIPDAQLWFYKKRYARRENALLIDLARAGQSLEQYRSLAELTSVLGEPGELSVGPRPELKSVAEPPPAAGSIRELDPASAIDDPQPLPSRLKH